VAIAWYRTKWFRVGGIVLLLGLLGAAAVPLLVPVDRVRPMLIRTLEAKIQRPVQIDAVRLHVVPTVYLQAINVRIGNPPGFPQGDTVLVKSVDLNLALRALLSRELDITSMTLSGVRMNVLRDTTGRTNLELHLRGGLLKLGRVGAIAVTNAEIAVAGFDAHTGKVTPLLTVSGVSASARPIDLTAPDPTKQLDATAVLRGAQITTPLLAAPVRFDAGTLVIKDGAARATFAAALGPMRMTGTVAIAELEPLSVIMFDVAVPELDVAGMKRLVIRGARGAFAVAPARRLLASGMIAIDRVVLSPLEATGVRGRVSVYTNEIQVAPYALSAYGGTIRGAASLQYTAAGLPVVATTTVRGLNVARAVSALSAGDARLTGSLDADLGLATDAGGDPEAVLTGAGTFAVRDGSFPRLELKGAMVKFATAVRLITVPAGPTRFSYLGGDVRIAHRRVYSNAIRLDGDGLEGTVRGSFGFDQTLDYSGTGALSTPPSAPSKGVLSAVGRLLRTVVPGTSGAAGKQVAFSVRGTFDDPKFSRGGGR